MRGCPLQPVMRGLRRHARSVRQSPSARSGETASQPRAAAARSSAATWHGRSVTSGQPYRSVTCPGGFALSRRMSPSGVCRWAACPSVPPPRRSSRVDILVLAPAAPRTRVAVLVRPVRALNPVRVANSAVNARLTDGGVGAQGGPIPGRAGVLHVRLPGCGLVTSSLPAAARRRTPCSARLPPRLHSVRTAGSLIRVRRRAHHVVASSARHGAGATGPIPGCSIRFVVQDRTAVRGPALPDRQPWRSSASPVLELPARIPPGM